MLHSKIINIVTIIISLLLFITPHQGDGWTALHIASWNGWNRLVQLLTASGAEIDQTGPGGVTALLLATQRGHVTVVQTLIAAGTDVTMSGQLRMIIGGSARTAGMALVCFTIVFSLRVSGVG